MLAKGSVCNYAPKDEPKYGGVRFCSTENPIHLINWENFLLNFQFFLNLIFPISAQLEKFGRPRSDSPLQKTQTRSKIPKYCSRFNKEY